MVRRLDAALFAEAGWFVIDAQNRRVPGVVVTSLAQGLELAGRGPVATVVGRLVEGVVVVDVDLAGDRGHAVAEEVASWCRARGVWHLVRPSGGAAGRSHVFVAAAGHQDGVRELVDQLRVTWKASRTTIDLRDTVRPLSAPHRSGSWNGPLGALTAALHGLERSLRVAGGPEGGPRVGHRRGTGRSPASTPLLPRRQRRDRDLAEEWQNYLSRGKPPAFSIDQPGSRSNVEALATAHLLWAGHDAGTAWEAVTTAHHKAFSKARSKGRDWWVRHVWNPAVEADDAHTGRATPDPATAAAIAAARQRLSESAWRQPEKSRPYYLIVGHVVLDRMERTAQLRIPVPERDLVLDTGMTDRRTLRRHLALLERAGVLFVHRDTLDDTARATTSYEAEIPPAPDKSGAPSQIPPPSFHTPHLPHTLPPDCPASTWLLLRSLTTDSQTLEELAQSCQLGAGVELSPRQARTIRAALTVLSRVGLARCDENGSWRRGPGLTRGATAEALERQQELRAVIEAERTAYRQRRGSSWDAQRALALKRQRAKEVAWWRGLRPDDRARRRASWSARFAAADVHTQQRLKAEFVERDRRRGEDPTRRHQEWVATHATEERRLRRAEDFAALPQPLQVASARSWQSHRDEHGIPRDLLPTGQILRELAASGPPAEEQESFDLLTLPTTTPGRASPGL